jgi:hypothetical protein
MDHESASLTSLRPGPSANLAPDVQVCRSRRGLNFRRLTRWTRSLSCPHCVPTALSRLWSDCIVFTSQPATKVLAYSARRVPERSLSDPVGDGPAGESMALRDHVAGCVHGPQGRLGVHVFRDHSWAHCPAIQPFRLALIADQSVSDRLQPLAIGCGVELAAEHPLAKVVPLREEPGPELEARDLPGTGVVDKRTRGQRARSGSIDRTPPRARQPEPPSHRRPPAVREAPGACSILSQFRGRSATVGSNLQRGNLCVATDENARISGRATISSTSRLTR